MTKTELIGALVERAGLTKVQACDALKVFETSIVGALANGDDVTLPGFGKFGIRETAARTGRNPATGETVQVPAGRKPYFMPSKLFKEAVKSR